MQLAPSLIYTPKIAPVCSCTQADALLQTFPLLSALNLLYTSQLFFLGDLANKELQHASKASSFFCPSPIMAQRQSRQCSTTTSGSKIELVQLITLKIKRWKTTSLPVTTDVSANDWHRNRSSLLTLLHNSHAFCTVLLACVCVCVCVCVRTLNIFRASLTRTGLVYLSPVCAQNTDYPNFNGPVLFSSSFFVFVFLFVFLSCFFNVLPFHCFYAK